MSCMVTVTMVTVTMVTVTMVTVKLSYMYVTDHGLDESVLNTLGIKEVDKL